MKKKLIAVAIPTFIICLGFILSPLSAQDSTRIIAVSAKEAADLIDKHNGDNDFAILDIRTPGEFQSGHLHNAILIDFYSQAFADQLNRLDKKKTYLIYCRTGNRSTTSLGLFKKLKFEKIYHMSTGISGWKSADLPVIIRK
jgi:rhodanese-related sulfurtransferase